MKVVPQNNVIAFDESQMSLISDSTEILKFLEFVGEKSILNQQTVSTRISACNHLFSILDEEQNENNVEFMLKNLNMLLNRYRNKNPNVTKGTLKVYKSRIKSALEDFKAWSRDPLAWEKSLSEKNQPEPKAKKEKVARTQEVTPSEGQTQKKRSTKARSVSFPLRKDFEIEMTLPSEGISLVELQRIGLFLFPYCQDLTTEKLSGIFSLPN